MSSSLSAPDLCDDACLHPASVRAARAVLLEGADARAVAATFATLADPTRLRLLHALSVRELCVCDLALVLGIKQPAVSQHLRLLRALGIVSFRKEGRVAYYALADTHVATLLAQGIAHLDCTPTTHAAAGAA